MQGMTPIFFVVDRGTPSAFLGMFKNSGMRMKIYEKNRYKLPTLEPVLLPVQSPEQAETLI